MNAKLRRVLGKQIGVWTVSLEEGESFPVCHMCKNYACGPHEVGEEKDEVCPLYEDEGVDCCSMILGGSTFFGSEEENTERKEYKQAAVDFYTTWLETGVKPTVKHLLGDEEDEEEDFL